jgi:hypothetical protein
MLRAVFGDTDKVGQIYIMCCYLRLPSSDEDSLAKEIIITEKQNIITNPSFTVFEYVPFVPM